MKAAATAVLALALAPFLQACGELGHCSRFYAPEFSAAEQQITRNDVITNLGEPMETITSEDGHRVDIYEYDRQCGGFVTVWLFPVFPYYVEKDQMFTVEYGPDGSYLTAEVWPDVENPGIIIATYELRFKKDAERRVRLEVCSLPFSEAIQLDAATQYERGLSCKEFGRLTEFYWECLAAHQGFAEARLLLGKHYKRGFDPISQDSVRAYLWFSLVGDMKNAVRYKDQQASVMTAAQLAEAERLVAEWKPNPAVCETIGAQAEN